MPTPSLPADAERIAAALLRGTERLRTPTREKGGQRRFLGTIEAWRRRGLPLYAAKLHGGLHGVRGRPDTTVVAAGASLWFELKRTGNAAGTSRHQDLEIAKLRAAGAHAEATDDVDRALRVVARTLLARGVSLPPDIASRHAD